MYVCLIRFCFVCISMPIGTSHLKTPHMFIEIASFPKKCTKFGKILLDSLTGRANMASCWCGPSSIILLGNPSDQIYSF